METLNSMQRFSNGTGDASATLPGGFTPAPSAPFSDPSSSASGKSRTAALREQALAYLRQQGDTAPTEQERQQLERLRYGW